MKESHPMNSFRAIVVLLSLFAVACGGSANEAGNSDAPSTLKAALNAGEPVIGSWKNGAWVQTIDATGNGYITKVGTGYHCWSVGAQSFRNLVQVGPNAYSGECGTCSGSSVVWGPVYITVTADGGWMTEYFNGTSASWYKI
jgi:hypothetical protein